MAAVFDSVVLKIAGGYGIVIKVYSAVHQQNILVTFILIVIGSFDIS